MFSSTAAVENFIKRALVLGGLEKHAFESKKAKRKTAAWEKYFATAFLLPRHILDGENEIVRV